MKRLFVLVALLSIAIAPALADAGWLNPSSAGGSGATVAPAVPPPHPASRAARARSEPPETASLQEEARRFTDTYWDFVGDSAPFVLHYLRSSYAPVVEYYGRATSKDAVLADKQRYLQRWPRRTSWPPAAAGNPQIACDDGNGECTIRGVRDFDNSNPATGAHASGRFSYDYRLRFRRGSAQIVAERSTVIAGR